MVSVQPCRPYRGEARACLPLIQSQQITVVTVQLRLAARVSWILILDDLAWLPTAGGQLAVLGHGVLLSPTLPIRSHGVEEDGIVLVERAQRLPTGRQQAYASTRGRRPKRFRTPAGRSGCRRRSPPAHRARARGWWSGSARRPPSRVMVRRPATSGRDQRRRASSGHRSSRARPPRPASHASHGPATAGVARDRSACACQERQPRQKNEVRVVLSAARISTTAKAKSVWVRWAVGATWP